MKARQWQRLAALTAAVAGLAACGGGGGDQAPAPAPTGSTAPTPGPAPAPPSPQPPPPTPPAPQANDLLCGTVRGGPFAGSVGCAENGSFHYGSTARSEICLGAGCPNPFSYQVRIDTRASYRGPLTASLVACQRAPTAGLDNDANCPTAVRNDAGHHGMLEVRFDPPNGAVGPQTSITIQILTATYGVSCGAAGAPSPFSDANHVLVRDDDGNRLYLPVGIAASCTSP